MPKKIFTLYGTQISLIFCYYYSKCINSCSSYFHQQKNKIKIRKVEDFSSNTEKIK